MEVVKAYLELLHCFGLFLFLLAILGVFTAFLFVDCGNSLIWAATPTGESFRSSTLYLNVHSH